MKTIVVIPTYNEKENLRTFLPEILNGFPEVDVLVVDDNSPDGTARLVIEVQKTNPRLKLLSRPGKQGLGPAYVAGFKLALSEGYELIAQMDADFSHRFIDLRKLLDAAKDTVNNVDFAVGARWIPGGKISNWSLWRRILSLGGNIYVQLLMGSRLHDWTGGFNVWKRHVLSKIALDGTEAHGYCFQIELKWQALRLNFRPVEVPIVFEERRAGQSKMSIKIILEALLRVCLMRFKKN